MPHRFTPHAHPCQASRRARSQVRYVPVADIPDEEGLRRLALGLPLL
jgi:hypothetical protein